jgi:hypothetical protein
MSLLFRGRRMKQARNQHEAGSKQCSDIQQATWRYIPDEITLRNHRSENLKCEIPVIFTVVLKYIINELEWMWLS